MGRGALEGRPSLPQVAGLGEGRPFLSSVLCCLVVGDGDVPDSDVGGLPEVDPRLDGVVLAELQTHLVLNLAGFRDSSTFWRPEACPSIMGLFGQKGAFRTKKGLFGQKGAIVNLTSFILLAGERPIGRMAFCNII